MAKRNVYFPAALEQRMDQFANVNWSRVCQEAVERKIEELDAEYAAMRRYEETSAILI